MKILQPLIKYTGSKRSQIAQIQTFVPKEVKTYIEPFVGGANVVGNLEVPAEQKWCSDIMGPLIGFYQAFQTSPDEILKHYSYEWELLQKDTNHFYKVRDRFNKEMSSYDFFFLSRTSHNGLIRFNSKGEFNAPVNHSPDRNKGITPDALKSIFEQWTPRLNNVRFVMCSYQSMMHIAAPGDWIYMDPPYKSSSAIYGANTFVFSEFVSELEKLNQRGIQWACSYNGENNDDLKAVSKHHALLLSGQSSFRKLNKKNQSVIYESIYSNYVPS